MRSKQFRAHQNERTRFGVILRGLLEKKSSSARCALVARGRQLKGWEPSPKGRSHIVWVMGGMHIHCGSYHPPYKCGCNLIFVAPAGLPTFGGVLGLWPGPGPCGHGWCSSSGGGRGNSGRGGEATGAEQSVTALSALLRLQGAPTFGWPATRKAPESGQAR